MFNARSNRESFYSFLVYIFLLMPLVSCAYFGANLRSSDGKISHGTQAELKPKCFQTHNAWHFFGAKLEPPAGKVFHGAQGEVRPLGLFSRHVDWDGIEVYSRACGHRPKLIMHYISFDPLAFWLLKSTIFEISQRHYDYIPQIGLDFYSYIPGFDIMNPKDITHEIAKGDYNDKIKELAQLFIEMRTPVFLRPGYEFGGNGQGRHASRLYWVIAWKRIFEIFKNEGAENVAFVWNTLDARDYMRYYPGDEYIDWWGINVFCDHADKHNFINSFIQDAEKHKKPVMIAESTPRHIGSAQGKESWQKWYAPYFNLISKYPHIKAFCYINASWKDWPDKSFSHDCRIQSNQLVSSRYRKLMLGGQFINASKK
jgi:hypothetical protein